MYKRGSIILVPFPFTDLSSSKLRPALVISNEDMTGEDIIAIFISSIAVKPAHDLDVFIKKGDQGFQETGLKADSLFKCGKIATLDRKIIIGQIGSLPSPYQARIDKNLFSVLGLSAPTGSS